jgi:hypothetical protein
MQRELFDQALAELRHDPDLVNQVLEISLERGALRILRYHLPPLAP